MADMKALQVTRHGPPGEVLAVRTVVEIDRTDGEASAME